MSNREHLPEWIAMYNEKTLMGDDLKAFLKMLENNPALQREVKLDEELNHDLEDEDLIDLRRRILAASESRLKNNDITRKLLLLAASLVILLALEILINHLCSRPDGLTRKLNLAEKNAVQTTQESFVMKHPGLERQSGKTNSHHILNDADKAGIDNSLAVNFRPDPVFEGLVGVYTRSEYFRLKTPAGQHRFTTEKRILFDWESASDKRFKLIILDNTGNELIDTGPVLVLPVSLDHNLFKPGLFYFKVIRNEDILYFGKFFVEDQSGK